jgi:hypothetical protein
LIEKYEKNNQFKEKSVILNNLFEVALLENKCEFVSLLLKYGVMLSEFLGFRKDNNRLKLLYNNECVSCFFSNVF